MGAQTDRQTNPRTGPSRRITRWLIRGLRAVVLLLAVWLLIAGAALAVLNTTPGQAWLAGLLEDMLAEQTGAPTARVSVEGTMAARIRIEAIGLRDGAGTWAHVDRLAVDWRPAWLLAGRVEVTDIRASGIGIDRLPEDQAPAQSGPPEKEKDRDGDIDLAELAGWLARVRIAAFSANDITVHEAVAGVPLSLALSGQLTPDETGRPALNLSVRKVDTGLDVDAELDALVQLAGRRTIAVDLTGRLDRTVLAGAGRVNVRSGALGGRVTLTHDAGARQPLTLADGVTLAQGQLTAQAVIAATGPVEVAHLSLESGPTRLTFAGSLDPSAMRATGTVELSTAELGGVDPMLARLLGQTAELSGSITASADAVTLTEARLEGPGAAATGEVDLDLHAGLLRRAVIDVHLPDLSRIQPTVDGAARLAVTAAGPLATPAVTVRATSAQITTGRQQFTTVDLTSTADLAAAVPTIALNGTADSMDGPLTLQGTVTLPETGHMRIGGLALSGAGMDLRGDVGVATETGLITGTATATLNTMVLPAALVSAPLSGRGQATLSFGTEAGTQVLEAELTGADLVYGAGQAGARRLELAGKISDPFGQPVSDLTARFTDLTLGTTTLANATVTAAGPMDRLEATLTGTLSSITGADGGRIDADAQLDLTGTQREIRLTRAGLETPDRHIRLATPARLVLGADTIVLEQAEVLLDEGTLMATLALNRATDTVSGHLTGTDLPLELLTAAAPDYPVRGRLEFNARLDGRPSSANLVLSGTVSDLVLPDAEVDGLAVDIAATITGGRLDATATAVGDSFAPATLRAALPFTLDLQEGRSVIDRQGPIEGRVTWQGDIGPLMALTPLITHRLSGAADVDIRATGSLETPHLTGQARLAGGRYENLDTGTILTDLAIALQTDGQAGRLSLTATDGGSGRIEGDGTITFADQTAGSGQPPQGPDVAIDLRVNRAKLVRRDDLTLTGSADLAYRTVDGAGVLSGTLDVHDATVSLTGTYAESIPTLEVIDPDAPPGTANAAPATPPTRLDLRLTADSGGTATGPVKVAGRGLDSEWRADIAVGGTSATPLLTGSLDLVRGDYAFLGQGFDLVSGTVAFRGNPRIDPDLAIEASKSAETITARLSVSGRASAPVIRLGSTPPYPEDEILSRLLFSKSAGELGPLEALEVANAAAEVSGLTGRGGIVGTLRRTVGLDVLRVSGNGAGGSSVLIGQQITRDIFVGVQRGLETTSNEIIVDWKIGNSLSLRSTTNDETGADIGLSWQKSY